MGGKFELLYSLQAIGSQVNCVNKMTDSFEMIER